jgi:hypothetical protein
MPIPAVVFLPPAAASRAEQWMGAVRAACAADLLERLLEAGYAPVYLAGPTAPADAGLGVPDVRHIPVPDSPFHFGRAFARIIESRKLVDVAYFGAASAPLAEARTLAGWRGHAQDLPAGAALVNHVHSTDWAILRDARPLAALADRLPTDNPIGWVLREEAGVRVDSPMATPASRMDIDTPGDLALVRRHPGLGPALRRTLEPFPPGLAQRADALAGILRTPARSLALIGRVSEEAWRQIVRRAQLWVRVFAEERGMRASGRLERGEVRSLVGAWVEEQGPKAFVRQLTGLVDGAFWDTRVWLAHRGPWPDSSDRMAADLGWTEDIADPALRSLTEAVVASNSPIVTGGQGIVAGSLRAFVETLLPDAGEGEAPQAG